MENMNQNNNQDNAPIIEQAFLNIAALKNATFDVVREQVIQAFQPQIEEAVELQIFGEAEDEDKKDKDDDKDKKKDKEDDKEEKPKSKKKDDDKDSEENEDEEKPKSKKKDKEDDEEEKPKSKKKDDSEDDEVSDEDLDDLTDEDLGSLNFDSDIEKVDSKEDDSDDDMDEFLNGQDHDENVDYEDEDGSSEMQGMNTDDLFNSDNDDFDFDLETGDLDIDFNNDVVDIDVGGEDEDEEEHKHLRFKKHHEPEEEEELEENMNVDILDEEFEQFMNENPEMMEEEEDPDAELENISNGQKIAAPLTPNMMESFVQKRRLKKLQEENIRLQRAAQRAEKKALKLQEAVTMYQKSNEDSTLLLKKSAAANRLVKEFFAGANQETINKVYKQLDKAKTIQEVKNLYTIIANKAKLKKESLEKNLKQGGRKLVTEQKVTQTKERGHLTRNVLKEMARTQQSAGLLADLPIPGRTVDMTDVERSMVHEQWQRLAGIKK